MFPYALPIISDSADQMRLMASNAEERFSYFEFWLDYLPENQLELAREFAAEYGGRAIFLLRRQRLEPPQMPLQKRIELITALAETDSFLDLDLVEQAEEVTALQSLPEPPGTILSFHDYSSTPSDSQLAGVVAEMRKLKADVSKIATYCNTEEDALRLLKILLQLREEGRRCIVLGMGVHGAVTRIFGTLWGNEMIFAPESRLQSSAPGQLTIHELEQCFTALQALQEENKNDSR